MRKCILFFAFSFVSFTTWAQIPREGKFLGVITRSAQVSRVRTNEIVFNVINNASELQRAERIKNECENCKREYYGTGIPSSVDIKQQQFTDLEQGRLWQVAIESKDAHALQFYFDRYKLPEGSELYISNEAGTMTLGAFGSHNNHDDKKFATQTISGDRVTIFYFEPKGVSFPGELRISTVIHAFKNVYKSGFGSSQSCNKDINCPEGSSYQDIKKGVARISYYDDDNNFAAHCTGSLLNTTTNSKKPYMLTANHCVTPIPGHENDPGYRYWQWVVEFNYERAICNTGTIEPISNSVQGATLLSKGKDSDYALLNIGVVPDSYNVVYLGWDLSSSAVPTSTVAIHHPNGDVKKVSKDNDAPVLVRTGPHPTKPNEFIEVAGIPKTEFKVSWNSGITEYGSSGSPLFNQDKKVIGQLRGGGSDCSSPTASDYFGRLAVSANNPDEGSVYPYLRTLLDDGNIGASNWSSFDPKSSDEAFKINSIEITSNRWEDVPKLFGRISYNGNVQNLVYSWSPAADFVDPHAGVGILFFGGQKPALPLTRQYTLTVGIPGGPSRSQAITVTIYDCANKDNYLDLCHDTSSKIGLTAAENESYFWSPANYLSSTNVSDPVFTPPAKGAYEYSLTVTSAACTRIENYHVTVVGPPVPPSFVPSVLSQKAILTSTFGSKSLMTSDGYYLFLAADYMLTKTDANFNILWSKRCTTSNWPFFATDVVEVQGGYVILSRPVASNVRNSVLLNKVNTNGDILWETWEYPESSQESYDAHGEILKLSNGNIAIAGDYRNSSPLKQMGFLFIYNGDGTRTYSKMLAYRVNNVEVRYKTTASMVTPTDEILIMADRFLIRMNIPGLNEIITKSHALTTLQGSDYTNLINKMVWGHDGKIIGLGQSFNPATGGSVDVRMIKFDVGANLLWTNYFGGTADEGSFSTVIPTSDGGYILGTSSNSPISGNKSQAPWNSGGDYWVVKTDNDGNKLGDVRFGGTAGDQLTDVVDAGLGKYLIVGSSNSPVSGDRTAPQAPGNVREAWVLKILDTNSPSTNPTPQISTLCTSSNSSFNNAADPYRNDAIVVGGCPAPLTFESGSVTSMRASQYIVIRPGVHIKAGSGFYARIGSMILNPCEEIGFSGSSLDTEVYDGPDVRLVDPSELNVTDGSAPVWLRIFPNPSKDGRIGIEIDLAETSDIFVTVSNSLGKPEFVKHYRDVSRVNEFLDMSEVADGVYIISVQSSKGAKHEKVVISR